MAGLSNVVFSFTCFLLLFETSFCYLYYKEPELQDNTCHGNPNNATPWHGKPTLLKQVENGSLYSAGDGEDQLYGETNNTS